MKKWLVLLFFFAIACGNDYEQPTNDLDCGRQFIEAIFDGNFKRARQLMVSDETNLHLLNNKLAKDFRNRTSLDKDLLRNASIVINKVEKASDSVTILHFLNAYDSKPTHLKIVNRQNEWMIDLKYTF